MNFLSSISYNLQKGSQKTDYILKNLNLCDILLMGLHLQFLVPHLPENTLFSLYAYKFPSDHILDSYH